MNRARTSRGEVLLVAGEGKLSTHERSAEIIRSLFGEGRIALVESLELKRAAFGEQHASTAYALEHLASLELDAGRHDDALAFARRALAARRATLGDDHQMTGLTWKAVATIQAAAGRCSEGPAKLRVAPGLLTGRACRSSSRASRSSSSSPRAWTSPPTRRPIPAPT